MLEDELLELAVAGDVQDDWVEPQSLSEVLSRGQHLNEANLFATLLQMLLHSPDVLFGHEIYFPIRSGKEVHKISGPSV